MRWNTTNVTFGTKYISAFQALTALWFTQPGATRSASLRACPWLSYFAPLALRTAKLLVNARFLAGRRRSFVAKELRRGLGLVSDLRPDPVNGYPETKAYEIRNEDGRKAERRIDAATDQGRDEQ